MVQEAGTSATEVMEKVGEALGTETSPGQVTEPATTEAQEPKSYDEWLNESLGSNEEWKSAHEASQEKLRRDSFNEVNSRLKPIMEKQAAAEHQRMQWAQQSLTALSAINERFEKAMEDGSFDQRTVRAAYQEHLANLSGLSLQSKDNGLREGRQEGIDQTVHFLIDQALGAGTKVAKKHRERLDKEQRPLSDVLQDVIADAKAPLEAEIRSLKAKLEGGRGDARAGQGPNMARARGGSAGDDRARLLDPKTPVPELIEIRKRLRGQ